MTHIELLAPAKDLNIGIAAIDCGADAVYIAGPAFGARQAAGNSVEDIRSLCRYAHRYGAKIYVTVNTILFDDEVEEAQSLALALQEAGADALIVQDLSMLALLDKGLEIPLHASTQCSIQDVGKAKLLESFGFSRLVLERELPLSKVREIASAVDCEIECFVHGALCVCYSGQCYLSEMLCGRSANRGSCIQACRSRYDLVDSNGHLIEYPDGRPVAAGKTLLSLKDLNLSGRLEDLAAAGVSSFKIEGRLKNISYVRNTVSAYSQAIDALVDKYPDRYDRLSYGRCDYGFVPDLNKTFNRSYTSLFIDGKRGRWACLDAGKSRGEEIGIAEDIIRRGNSTTIFLKPLKDRGGIPVLHNGDGFFFIGSDGEDCGFRADTCNNCDSCGDCTPSNNCNGIEQPGRRNRHDSKSRAEASSRAWSNGRDSSNGRTGNDGRRGNDGQDGNDGRDGSNYRTCISCGCSDNINKLRKGAVIYRNLDTSFEKELSKSSTRSIDVKVGICFRTAGPGRGAAESAESISETESPLAQEFEMRIIAESEDGRTVTFSDVICAEAASNRERMLSMIRNQLSKSAGIYKFHIAEVGCSDGELPLMKASAINELRRIVAERLDSLPVRSKMLLNRGKSSLLNAVEVSGDVNAGSDTCSDISSGTSIKADVPQAISYKYDVANLTAKKIWELAGAENVEESYEQTHRQDAELMRTKYCLKYELGLCPKFFPNGDAGSRRNPPIHGKLFIRNNGRMLELRFDCTNCEMTVHNA